MLISTELIFFTENRICGSRATDCRSISGRAGRIKIGGDKVVLGVKAPFGAYYKFKNMPFSMFFELAPGLNLTPSTEFDIMGGLGFRYIFGGSGGSAADEPAGEDTRRERR
jgi:hypothetical protein